MVHFCRNSEKETPDFYDLILVINFSCLRPRHCLSLKIVNIDRLFPYLILVKAKKSLRARNGEK